MVAVSMVKPEGGKVSCETPEGTMINITINLDTTKTVQAVKKDGQDNTPTNETHSREPLVAGVCFICLGCFNVMMGVVIAFVHPNLDIYDSGAHLCVGFTFIVSGMLNIVAYKKPKAFWVVITFISLLSCLVVTIAGLVFVHRDLTSIWRRNDMTPLCDEVHQIHPYPRIDSVKIYNRNEAELNLERCKSGFQQYQNLLYGVVVMSSIIIACGLSIIIIALNYSLQMISSSCNCEKAEEDEDDPLLLPNPTQDIVI